MSEALFQEEIKKLDGLLDQLNRDVGALGEESDMHTSVIASNYKCKLYTKQCSFFENY